MGKTIGSAVAILLPLLTVYYWFEVREPAAAVLAAESLRPHDAASQMRADGLCLKGTDTGGVDVRVHQGCSVNGKSEPSGTVGAAAEVRGDSVVVTGYDL